MSDTVESTKHECPICKNVTMVEHCESKSCDWTMCKTPECGAVLSLTHRRGHHFNLDGEKDPKTKGTRRERVELIEGVWRERPYGGA